ncbi:MAG: sigma-70 family RNA polymerase sigma factor [Planctomycetota bacterium]
MNAVTQPLCMDATPTTKSSDTHPEVEAAAAASAEVGELDLGRLVERHQAAIWRYLRYLGARPAEADDLTQEVFLSVARTGFEQRTDAHTSAYLRTAARNRLISLRRKTKREVALLDDDAADEVWAQRTSDGWDEQVEALRGCVATLEGRARQAIDRHYRERASRDAIAESLGMTADGVKSLLRRTRAVLRDCVERTMRTAT